MHAEIVQRIKPAWTLEVDGGIDMHTAAVAVGAGANVLVAGTSIFGAKIGARLAVQQMSRVGNDRAGIVNPSEPSATDFPRPRILRETARGIALLYSEARRQQATQL